MTKNRQKLTAHVACDTLHGSSRQFVFTPTGEDGKSRAAIVMDENGVVTCHRSTVELSQHAAALSRWAAIYFKRSIPAAF